MTVWGILNAKVKSVFPELRSPKAQTEPSVLIPRASQLSSRDPWAQNPSPRLTWWQQLLLAFQVIALHVTLALGIIAWERLPILVHTPADTPLPAFGGTALWEGTRELVTHLGVLTAAGRGAWVVLAEGRWLRKDSAALKSGWESVLVLQGKWGMGSHLPQGLGEVVGTTTVSAWGMETLCLPEFTAASVDASFFWNC